MGLTNLSVTIEPNLLESVVLWVTLITSLLNILLVRRIYHKTSSDSQQQHQDSLKLQKEHHKNSLSLQLCFEKMEMTHKQWNGWNKLLETIDPKYKAIYEEVLNEIDQAKRKMDDLAKQIDEIEKSLK